MVQVTCDDHGAVGDGAADDTAAVQAAVDDAHRTGGGRVVLTGGRHYLCGSIELRSGVDLHLEHGSRLIAARRIEQFSRRIAVGALAAGRSGDSTESTGALLWAENAADIAITGTGVIDGSARSYVVEEHTEIYRMSNARPFPLFFVGCERVVLRDVRFVDAALWTVRLSGCRHVSIIGIAIANDMRVPNADGIDLDHCTRVQVVGCDIRCPDDGISLKTTDEFLDYGACEDVVITGCTVESLSTAITLGVDADSPIRHVVVGNCVVRNSHRGISVSVGTGREGTVEDVLFTDLVIETRHADDDWWGSGEPIVIRSAPWHDAAGAVRRIRVRNVLARSENGIVVHAAGGGYIEDVELRDIRLELARWTGYPGHRLDLRPFDGAPTEDAYRTALLRRTPDAVLVHGAHDVRLHDVRVRHADPASSEFGAALHLSGTGEVRWSGFETDRPPAGQLRTVDGTEELASHGSWTGSR